MNATISIAIIVKNAEATFDRCLSSFSQVADEIVVVDTGSTDKTIEIAKKYTDKIFHRDWIDDFSDARNYCFDQCTCDFIWWNDSDDYILPEDIEKAKNFDFTGKEIIICNYVYAHDEFGNSTCNVPRERIVKRSLGLRWQEPIHEYLPLAGQVFTSEINTWHNKQHGTSERNLAILEKIVQERDSSRNIYYLAKEYQEAGRTDDALYYFNLFVNRPDGFWEDRYTAHYRMAQCYLSKGDDHRFLHHIWESIKIEDRRAEPFYEMANYWLGKGNYDRAIQWYETCLSVRRPKDLLATYQPDYYTWLPCLNLCLSYNSIGDIKKAYEYNLRVLEYRPHDSRALSNDRILAGALNKPLWIAPNSAESIPVKSEVITIEKKAAVPVIHSPIKIGWVAPINWDAAQVRIRVLNVNKSLQAKGYQSEIVPDYQAIIDQNYDIAIVGKYIDESTYNNIKKLKAAGKTVYADICESLFEFPWFKEILGLCDKVICCSYKLEEQVQSVNKNTVVIEDAWESQGPEISNDEIWSICQSYKIQQKKSEFLWLIEKIKLIKDYQGIGADIGTYDGGSSAGLSYICKKLTTIDINPIRFNPDFNPGCLYNYIHGDSKSSEIIWKLKIQLNLHTKKGTLLDFLFIDGDHYYPGASSDFNSYKEFVKPGGIIAFHDIAKHPNGWSEVDVLWNELKLKYRTEEFIDSPYDQGGIGIIFV